MYLCLVLVYLLCSRKWKVVIEVNLIKAQFSEEYAGLRKTCGVSSIDSSKSNLYLAPVCSTFLGIDRYHLWSPCPLALVELSSWTVFMIFAYFSTVLLDFVLLTCKYSFFPKS